MASQQTHTYGSLDVRDYEQKIHALFGDHPFTMGDAMWKATTIEPYYLYLYESEALGFPSVDWGIEPKSFLSGDEDTHGFLLAFETLDEEEQAKARAGYHVHDLARYSVCREHMIDQLWGDYTHFKQEGRHKA